MSEQFKHGYALLVGIDANQVGRLALPTVKKDVGALHNVLVHPERCGYLKENVHVLTGNKATRTAILDELMWLQDCVADDENATVIVYYSGHGMRDREGDTAHYYLIPYDMRERRMQRYALPAEDFNAEIADLMSQRLLVILDCCHAAGVDAKDVLELMPAAFPASLPFAKSIPDFEAGRKDASLLAQGNGRAILSSSTGAQSSYIRSDGAMSIFTYHLIEALTGHGEPKEGAREVLVTDVMSHVTRHVQQTAQAEGHQQTPVMKTTGVFPVVLLLGGKGISKGEVAPDPLQPLSAPAASTTIDTGGGAYIGGGVDTGGGDFTGRDRVTYGDHVEGGRISVGDISGGTGIAIGPEAHAEVSIQHGIESAQLDQLFAPLIWEVMQQAPAQHKTEAIQKVEAMKEEAARGDKADDGTMAGLIEEVVTLVPDAVETIVGLFTSSALAKVAGGATKYVINKIQRR